MSRSLLLLVFLFLLPVAALASAPGPSLDLGAHSVLRGRFVHEHHVQGLAKPMRSEGRFTVAPGTGLIWAVEKPLPLTLVVTPVGAVQLVGDMPLLKQSAQQMPFLAHVTDLLTAALCGDWTTLEPDFAIKQSGSAKRWKVTMTPRPGGSVKMPFRELTAIGSRMVDRAELTRPDGGLDTVAFSDQAIASVATSEEKITFDLVVAPQ